jgi:hypothetical protein
MLLAENTRLRFRFHVTDEGVAAARSYRVRFIDPIRSSDVANALPQPCGRVRIPQENHRIGVAETRPNGSACVVLLYACPAPAACERSNGFPKAVT